MGSTGFADPLRFAAMRLDRGNQWFGVLGIFLLGSALVFGSSNAHAALTSSEKGQIRDLVASARAENAQKVRSLVARTDLTTEESVSALTEAVEPVVWSEPRATFLRDIVFSGPSAPSRPILTLATVKAVLARADAVHQRYVGGLDHEPRALAELFSIYRWLDTTIANAGKPTLVAHDSSAGIPDATYDECSKALRDHVERNARWLKGDAVIPESVAAVRAQAAVTLIDMLPDGLTRRIDAADRLALKGARRTMLIDWGILFADAGANDESKVERVRQVLMRMPSIRGELGLLFAGETRSGPLSSRGGVTYVARSSEPYPLADVAPKTYDPTTSAIVHGLTDIAARRVLERHAEFRAQVERDAAASSGDRNRLLGRSHAPSAEHVLGAAIHALLVDGPRAVEIATARLVEGRPETAALLSDALGALARISADEGKEPKASFDLAKGTGWTPATAVHLAPNGTVVGFVVEGHTWAIDRVPPNHSVASARRDGAVLSFDAVAPKKKM